MKLWLDDLFNNTVSAYKPTANDWLWVKNYKEFEETIQKNQNKIELISFDNDLGEDLEGKHCFNLMEELLHDGQLQNLKKVILHSDNSGAVSSMMTAKDSLKRHFDIDLERLRRVISLKKTSKLGP